MKFAKTLMAAALLASSAGANAAITTTSTTGLNEAFLSVYDSSRALTFTLDLGATYNDFFNNLNNAAFSLSFNLSSLTASAPVAASWNTFATGLNAATTSWGVMVTNGVRTMTTGENAIATFSATTASAVANAIRLHANAINGGAAADNGSAGTGAANLSSIVADSDTSNTGQHNHQLPFATIFGQVSAADANINGEKGDFWFYNSTAGNSQAVQDWKLNLASGTLTYAVAAPVSQVPLPAAVWMFGAGLMGVLRLNRRKSAAV